MGFRVRDLRFGVQGFRAADGESNGRDNGISHGNWGFTEAY